RRGHPLPPKRPGRLSRAAEYTARRARAGLAKTPPIDDFTLDRPLAPGERSLEILRQSWRVAVDAFIGFNKDDGWAIASHIALSTLMAMFPFFILLTAIAGFLGSKNIADDVASLMLSAWP